MSNSLEASENLLMKVYGWFSSWVISAQSLASRASNISLYSVFVFAERNLRSNIDPSRWHLMYTPRLEVSDSMEKWLDEGEVEQQRSGYTALFHPIWNFKSFWTFAIWENLSCHALAKQLDTCGKPFQAAKFSEDNPQCVSIDCVECLCLINEDCLQTTLSCFLSLFFFSCKAVT